MIASADILIILCYSVTCSSFQHSLVEGVHLPSDISFSVLYFPNLTAEAAIMTARFFATYAPLMQNLSSINKSDLVTSENDEYTTTTISPVYPLDYLHFGYGRNYLNAFIMASLRSGPRITFEIDRYGKRGSTYFSRFSACFTFMAAEAAISTARFFAIHASEIKTLIGMNKSDPVTGQNVDEFVTAGYAKTAFSPTFPQDCMHFGYRKNNDNLPDTFKTNPFFMASLRSGPGMTFEIDPFGKRGSTYFSRFIACLGPTVLRVSATFDYSMTIVIDLKVFNSSDSNNEMTGFTEETAATLLLHQSSFYAQNIHTLIHVSN